MSAAVRRRIGLAAALLVATLTVAGTANASSTSLTIDRGVVQSVSQAQIVLRELDGSSVSLAVGPNTRVLLNGLPAQLGDIQPGFVAAVTHNGARPARVVRAFGRVAPVIDRGVERRNGVLQCVGTTPVISLMSDVVRPSSSRITASSSSARSPGWLNV